MSLDSSRKLNILQQSPHDRQPIAPPTEPVGLPSGRLKWFPSRFNVRATSQDGKLILWNTYHGSMSVFEPHQKPTIESMLSKKGFEARAEGIVKYLHKRGFLIREGADELRQFQLTFGQRHYRTDMLQFFLLSTEDCNFRCQYCYEEFARGTMQPWVRTGIKNYVLSRLDSLRHLSVSWFGGEPLYGFAAIEDLGPFFVETAEEHGLSYFSYMTTNGYLLTPEVAEKLLRWRVKGFQITLDGPPETHDCNRPTRDGRGTFETIFDNIKQLSKRPDDFAVNIRVNFDQNNHPHMERFLDMVAKEFRDDPRYKLRFHPVGRWGGPKDQDLEVCGINDAQSVKMQLQQAAHARGLYVGGNLKEVTGPGTQVCYAGRPYNLVVGATGRVMKCTVVLDTKDYNVVGQLTEDGHMELEHDKMALWTEPAFENDSKCKKCILVPTCQGLHCPMVRIKHDKAPCPPMRRNIKKEMMEVHQVSEDRKNGRKVNVSGNSATAQPAVPTTA